MNGYPTINFDAFGALPSDTGLSREAVCCPTNDPADQYIRTVLDHVRQEAVATRGSLRLAVAVAVLIIDRKDRMLLTEREAIRALDLASTDVCGIALFTGVCPQNHEWASVLTPALERFELPFKPEVHS